ncbi:hypothetical protein JOB18_008258 [Solea senegalensis]|uniref:Uncharacterized protein n=1 Tax=Solea senegalensis TaxID=28829 RepID=A0AAV6SCY8_SOLSE|nr:hypothetical protein JOB18_008258 [Solea senegalensis]
MKIKLDPTRKAGPTNTIRCFCGPTSCIITVHPSLNSTEKQVFNFLAVAVIHVFSRTGVLKGLSDLELSYHISQLVTHTRKRLTIVEGHLPHISKAKSVAKAAIKELQKTFGETLKNMLLEHSPDVETAIVLCIQKRAKRFRVTCLQSLMLTMFSVPVACIFGMVAIILL